jgi:multicomponent Na+:H+ antiporter subunit A
MLMAVLSGFLFALSLVPLGKYLKGRALVLATLLPLLLSLYFASLIPRVAAGETISFVYEWAPTFGVNLSFHVDGLSLLFALIISGIGVLVFWYASAYMKDYPYVDRFYGYLSVFMGAMLGMVLSDNVVSLFIFWELTSISSFFLIGFNNEDAAARRSALVALGITGMGGLLLLAGALLMGSIAGTYSIQGMLNAGVDLPGHGAYGLILCLVFGAAFTKSAQFPFHFWLPGAMRAPTPVSTYLHSATMVKAGVYLLMRFTPLLGGHPYWEITLCAVGGTTMLYAAVQLLFRTDLKSILAYSTISALGIMIFLTGLGHAGALLAAPLFVLAHALYKATLFLIAGILEKQTGTRDASRLSGLGKAMPLVAVAGALAALSNAGVPPTVGFLGKDLVYEATLHMDELSLWLTAAVVLTNIMLIFAGYAAGVKPFVGRSAPAGEKKPGPMPPALWAPPLLLAGLGLLFGLWPLLIDQPLVKPAAAALGVDAKMAPLKLWHGFNLVLLLSALTIAAGALLCLLIRPSAQLEGRIARWAFLSPERLVDRFAAGFQAFAARWTKALQSGYLRFYILPIIFFFILLLGYNLLSGVHIYADFSTVSELELYEIAILLIMFVAVIFTVFTNSRLTAVAAMGVVGYAMCLLFVFFSAPDLAMTQFTIDTLTVILFVLVLYRLPKYLLFSNTLARLRDGAMAISLGALITLLALEVLNEPHFRETGDYYAENAYVLAKGKNVVNVILVDFRGLDTLVEVSVLTAAAIGVFSLLKLRMKRQ